MIPIVFCASFVPWESENRLPVTHWPSRKPRVTGPGWRRPTIRYASEIASAVTASASTGATSAGTMTFSTIPAPSTASGPAATNADPTMPPISACEDEEGRPKYQVARFHAIAPISPAKTIEGVITSAWTMPVAIVAATWSDRNAPTKLRVEASPTATRGGIARVEIEVATALAVSWNPFVKSNASAVPTTIQRTTSSIALAVLDHHAFEDVGRSLRGVDGLLEALEDALPADDHHRVDPRLEPRRERLAHLAVAVVLEPVDLDREVADVPERPQPRDRVVHLAACLVEDARQLLRLLHRRLDAVEPEVVRDLLDVVDDVVERGGQVEDVLALDRRDERLVEALDDVVRDPVALLLADHDLAGELTVVGPAVEDVLEDLAGLHDVAARLLEQVEELALAAREETGQPGHRRASVVVGNEALRVRAPRGQHLLEPLHLLGGDAVGVLRAGEHAGADLLGVGRHRVDHRLAKLGVALDELGLERVVDAEQVVVDEHLAVGARARSDADHRDLHVLHDQVGQLVGDRLEDDREAAGLLEREGVLEHLAGALGRAALGAGAAQCGP